VEVFFTVSEVAQRVGFSAAALRLWERQGLISPQRSEKGYRLFAWEDLDRIKHIAHLRTVDKLNPAAIKRVLGTAGRESGIENGAHAGPADPVGGAGFGRRLRRLRHERKLTLHQVSQGTGLSVSFVSSLEREQTGVSVPTLKRLLAFYGTTLVAVLEGAKRRGRRRIAQYTRAGKGIRTGDRVTGVAMEQLADGPIQMEPHLMEIQPGGGSEGTYTHGGEEFVYVLAGELEIVLADTEQYRLRRGESLYFPSDVEHRWRNRGRVVARLLWVNTPPTF
jgi:DNA-binding transcriptional MerR regulator/mannose-6-phosphate isomerase-like protein (cupin superfamily)